MKYKLIFILLPFCLLLNAQDKHINCLTFIDGKLPDRSVITGYFEVEDSIKNIRKFEFDYHIGEIRLTKKNDDDLKQLPFNQKILVSFLYRKEDNSLKKFETYILAGWLKSEYTIFRITTLKKGKYYFGITGPNFSSEFIKKEYLMIE